MTGFSSRHTLSVTEFFIEILYQLLKLEIVKTNCKISNEAAL